MVEETIDFYINRTTQEIITIDEFLPGKVIRLSNGEILTIADFMDRYFPYDLEGTV